MNYNQIKNKFACTYGVVYSVYVTNIIILLNNIIRVKESQKRKKWEKNTDWVNVHDMFIQIK